MNGYRHIFCIIPPYIIENIIEKGTHLQRQQAHKLMEHYVSIHEKRRLKNDLAASKDKPAKEKKRKVYSADSLTDLPGKLVRSEGDLATGDLNIDEAYDGAGETYDLFFETYGRNSIDDKGMDIISTVHYGKNYDNAFWNGEQMIYGDGDKDLPENERLFNRFTISVDVIGHELTHGVTQYEAQLEYYDQPGALNESFSDIFGSLVKQRSLKQTANEADWLIGKGLFTKNVKGEALRSMKEPGTAYNDPTLGKDPQPAHMRDFVKTTYDNGGVHINSGISNKAFYICALEIGGYAWEKAGKIWYLTLKEKLKPTSDFQDAANQTYKIAADLYGDGSPEQYAVKKGWAEVGIWVEEDSNVC